MFSLLCNSFTSVYFTRTFVSKSKSAATLSGYQSALLNDTGQRLITIFQYSNIVILYNNDLIVVQYCEQNSRVINYLSQKHWFVVNF